MIVSAESLDKYLASLRNHLRELMRITYKPVGMLYCDT